MTDPDVNERMNAIEQVRKVVVDRLSELATSPMWRLEEVMAPDQTHHATVILLGKGWPRLTVQATVEISVKITDDQRP